MKTNIELTETSEDVLVKFCKESRPKKFKTKEVKVNEALMCLDKFLTYLDEETKKNIMLTEIENVQ